MAMTTGARRMATLSLAVVVLFATGVPTWGQGLAPAEPVRILVLHGPNTNLFGIREPGVYGTTTFAQINERIEALAGDLGVEIEILQSNPDGTDEDQAGARRSASRASQHESASSPWPRERSTGRDCNGDGSRKGQRGWPIANSESSERMNIWPSEIAGLASVRSPTSLTASTSKAGDASSTVASPSSFSV